jgi:hypothetical protein
VVIPKKVGCVKGRADRTLGVVLGFVGRWALMGVLLLGVLGGCAARQGPETGDVGTGAPALGQKDSGAYPRAEDVFPGFEPFGPRLPLKDLLQRTLREQYYAPMNLYSLPPEGFAKTFYIQLRPEEAVLHLAKNVSRFVADPNGLAVGMSNGAIYLWSKWPCPSVTLPGKGHVGLLAWASGSPYLAASPEGRDGVFLFDIRQCVRVALWSPERRFKHIAVSSKGAWLGAVDEGHTLWLGKTPETPTDIARLRYGVLDLAFTPQEGVLMAVDEGGWITLWATHEKRLLEQFQVPGGPFRQARFEGARLSLTSREGTVQTWDLRRRVAVTPEKEAERFYLSDGVLRYRTWSKYLMKKIHLGGPSLRVWHSPSLGVVRVKDIDGKERYYSATAGRQSSVVETKDWRPVVMDDEYGFSLGEERFQLADPVFQKEHLRLYCRYVPQAGFFLWWKERTRPGDFNPFPNRLPARRNLKEDAPLTWEWMNSPEDLL